MRITLEARMISKWLNKELMIFLHSELILNCSLCQNLFNKSLFSMLRSSTLTLLLSMRKSSSQRLLVSKVRSLESLSWWKELEWKNSERELKVNACLTSHQRLKLLWVSLQPSCLLRNRMLLKLMLLTTSRFDQLRDSFAQTLDQFSIRIKLEPFTQLEERKSISRQMMWNKSSTSTMLEWSLWDSSHDQHLRFSITSNILTLCILTRKESVGQVK